MRWLCSSTCAHTPAPLVLWVAICARASKGVSSKGTGWFACAQQLGHVMARVCEAADDSPTREAGAEALQTLLQWLPSIQGDMLLQVEGLA